MQIHFKILCSKNWQRKGNGENIKFVAHPLFIIRHCIEETLQVAIVFRYKWHSEIYIKTLLGLDSIAESNTVMFLIKKSNLH